MEKDECTAAMAPENIDKNRFKNILPGKFLTHLQQMSHAFLMS